MNFDKTFVQQISLVSYIERPQYDFDLKLIEYKFV